LLLDDDCKGVSRYVCATSLLQNDIGMVDLLSRQIRSARFPCGREELREA
jgi:hypothetical protein